MSHEIASKIAYNVTEETLTLTTCSIYDYPRDFANETVITVDTAKDTITDIPQSVTSNHDIIMFALFHNLMTGKLALNSTISKKYRSALTITKSHIVTAEKGMDKNVRPSHTSEEYFQVFLNAITGKTTLTKGKFVIRSTAFYGEDLPSYYQAMGSDTVVIDEAKVFRNKEEATLSTVYYHNDSEVVELAV